MDFIGILAIHLSHLHLRASAVCYSWVHFIDAASFKNKTKPSLCPHTSPTHPSRPMLGTKSYLKREVLIWSQYWSRGGVQFKMIYAFLFCSVSCSASHQLKLLCFNFYRWDTDIILSIHSQKCKEGSWVGGGGHGWDYCPQSFANIQVWF